MTHIERLMKAADLCQAHAEEFTEFIEKRNWKLSDLEKCSDRNISDAARLMRIAKERARAS